MSLTSFIKEPDVAAKFRECFPLPTNKPVGSIKAEPQTKRYMMIGTAFDYLLRFYIEYNHNIPRNYWVAEIPFCTIHVGRSVEPEFTSSELQPNITEFPDSVEYLKEAKSNYRKFRKSGKIGIDLIESTIRLAEIDSLYRAAYPPDHFSINQSDVNDLKNLLDVAINTGIFKNGKFDTNPSFGTGSNLVGGADTDLFIDNTIVDIKTTKKLTLTRRYYNQVIGYYILDLFQNNGSSRFEKVGIYYSRHGILYEMHVSTFSSGLTDEFLTWFKVRAEEQFGEMRSGIGQWDP